MVRGTQIPMYERRQHACALLISPLTSHLQRYRRFCHKELHDLELDRWQCRAPSRACPAPSPRVTWNNISPSTIFTSRSLLASHPFFPPRPFTHRPLLWCF
ncbi:hypothetical protein TRVL_04756 [Trypanosoma vivax]|nr:hypothetical protein TRVL_04756 [Trypanosoma vivax]